MGAPKEINFGKIIRNSFQTLILLGATGSLGISRSSEVNLRNVVWTKDGACAVGTDDSRQVLGLEKKITYHNGTVFLLRHVHGGTKLGGPIGYAVDTNGDGDADYSSVLEVDGNNNCE